MATVRYSLTPKAYPVWLIAFICYSTIPFLSHAQILPKARTLTVDDGLCFRDVTAVFQDKDGLMWIGTRQGLNRYDGYHFVWFGNEHRSDHHFPGEDIRIGGINEVDDSMLVILADQEIYSLNRRSFQDEDITGTTGIRGNILQVQSFRNENLWIVSDDDSLQYLSYLTDGNRSKVIAHEIRGRQSFTHLAVDTAGNAWWSTVNGGLKQYSPQGDLLFAGKPDSFLWYGTEMYYHPLFIDSRNRVFILPKSKTQVWLYHPAERQIEVIADSLSTVAYCAAEDKLGNMWFSSKTELFRWSPDQLLTDFTSVLKNALHFSSIQQIYEDQTHLLWVATDNGLITFPNQQQLFTTRFNVPGVKWGNAMRGIFDDRDGRIYAYCENGKIGLHHTDPVSGKTEFTFVSAADRLDISLFEEARHFIPDHQENAFWTLNDQLMKIDLRTMSPVRMVPFEGISRKFSHNPFTRLSNQSFVIGSNLERLTIYHDKTGERLTLLKSNDPKLASIETEYFLEASDSTIWVGTANAGLYLISLSGEIHRHLTTESTPALSNNRILALRYDADSILWIGTFGGGLNRYDPKQNSITIYTQREGLANDNVTGILDDDEGNIWASTYNGLSCYHIKEGLFQNFFEEDGLSNNEFNYTSFFKDREGRLWFGGMNGVHYFNPADILEQRPNPPLVFTSFSKYNRLSDTLEFVSLNQRSKGSIRISPYDSYFICTWTLPNFFKPDKNRYYVWLEGLEADWSYVGNIPTVRYHKLPPGDYTLHVKGADSKGNWSATELSVSIEVRPFFYTTWWFITLCVLFVGALAYAFARYRLNRLLEMERMRTRIASDLHDEVGSMLSGVAMQAEILEMQGNASDSTKLQRLSEISRGTLSKMRDVVWSIDSRRDQVKNLLDRMREQAEEMLAPKDISFRFELGDLPMEKKLPVDVRQHLFLFFKEAINNIVKHSNANSVIVRLGHFVDHFELSVHDNGEPRQELTHATGFGLQNMEMRAKKLGGTFVVSRVDGFKVILSMRSL